MQIIVKNSPKIWNYEKKYISLRCENEREVEMNVRCTESIEKKMQGKSMTFRAGEEYTANTVNKHWYVVDSIGFETEEFGLHFEVLEEEVITEKEASKAVNEITHRLASYPEPDITPVWLDGEEEEHEDMESWWDKLMNYIFV